MHPARVLEVINNSRVPESRRKFWPRWSVVFVSAECVVIDVVQYFEQPALESVDRDHALYPNSAYFLALAGESYRKVEDLEAKLRSCRDAFDPKVLSPLERSHMALKSESNWVAGGLQGSGTAPPSDDA